MDVTEKRPNGSFIQIDYEGEKYIPLPLLTQTDFGSPFRKFVYDRLFDGKTFHIKITCLDKNGKELKSELYDTDILCGPVGYDTYYVQINTNGLPRTKVYELKFAAPEQIDQIAKITAGVVVIEQK